jgi:hypothetical protein
MCGRDGFLFGLIDGSQPDLTLSARHTFRRRRHSDDCEESGKTPVRDPYQRAIHLERRLMHSIFAGFVSLWIPCFQGI